MAPSPQMIDLRSDTVTRPTLPMLEAMTHARVGDDVFGEDETVNSLQEKVADLFGMEAALFCPSGTMTNQIGIKVHTEPGDEVICNRLAHIYRAEGGGMSLISGVSPRLLDGDHGRFTAGQVAENINPTDDSHFSRTRLVMIENTVDRGGGCCWDLAEIKRIRTVCNRHGLAMHLDGARVFNAIVARSEAPNRYGRLFDTISICLSKALGAPVGSVLLGNKDLIGKAHRIRKTLGGGMRQAGYLAAAGIYALDHHVSRLNEDHAKARILGRELRGMRAVSTVLPVETNIVIFQLEPTVGATALLRHLQRKAILASMIGPHSIRMVFHLDITDAHVDRVVTALRAFSP
jgi:threonine aldolase